jgi:hypothetical protein
MARREPITYRPTDAVVAKLKEVTLNGRKESYSAYTSRIMAEHFGLPNYDIDLAVDPPQQTLPLRDAG